jgi:hypothetical protein
MDTEQIIFMHIPKAAGQTVYGIIGRQYRREEILILKGNVGEIESPPSDAAAKIILGHVPFGFHRYLDGPSTYVTFLREPISRVHSLYRYIATSPRHHLHDRVSGVTLLEFVSGGIDAKEVENGQVRQVSGLNEGVPDAATLARAKQNLVESCRVVGLTERFDESLMLLKRTLGWRTPFYVPMNVTEGGPPSDARDAEALRTIEQRNALDIELYRFACDLFEERVRKEGPWFRLDVSVFRVFNATARVGRTMRDAARALRTKNASAV